MDYPAPPSREDERGLGLRWVRLALIVAVTVAGSVLMVAMIWAPENTFGWIAWTLVVVGVASWALHEFLPGAIRNEFPPRDP